MTINAQQLPLPGIAHAGQLLWYQADLLATPHALFTREGGTSQLPYDSLNLSFDVNDAPKAVAQNRLLIKKALQLEQLAFAKQVHGDQVVVVEKKGQGDIRIEDCDALITAEPGLGLLIQQADCQAILLYDPQHRVIAAIHCGWRGSVTNIIAKTITRMTREFGVAPHRLSALVSPSLGPCCAEFMHYRTELPGTLHSYHIGQNHFDFWQISRDQLTEAGLKEEKIVISAICTSCDRRFFSYRRSKKQGESATGRHGSVIALPA